MKRIHTMTAVMATLIAMPVMAAQITFYENEDFRGRMFATERPVADFNRFGFNDRASSVIVDSGEWLVCEDSRFGGQCVVLRPGSYDSLRRMGVNNRVSSVRRVDSRGRYDNAYRPEPLPEPTYEYRRRVNERLFEVPVTSVHAVVGPPEQHCWVEQEEVREPVRSGSNVGGAIVGGIIGGILGHQIGGGRGKDIATAGGAVAGAAIGANAGRGGGGGIETRDVRRCENVDPGPPDYWDVAYDYQGVVHHVQMTEPPGRTITVNRNGEPRM